MGLCAGEVEAVAFAEEMAAAHQTADRKKVGRNISHTLSLTELAGAGSFKKSIGGEVFSMSKMTHPPSGKGALAGQVLGRNKRAAAAWARITSGLRCKASS